MKKTLLFAAIAALFTIASCQKEETSVKDQKGDLVFTATIAGPDTKTSINASNGKVIWESEDMITITDCNNTSAKYSVSKIDENGIATFTKVEGQPSLGAAPYRAVYGTDPATKQTYSPTVPKLPMIAESDDLNLLFTVSCGLLELSFIYGSPVDSIKVTGTLTGGPDASYTLICPSPVEVKYGGKFFLALPAGSYNYIGIAFSNHTICTKQKTGESISIEANHIQPISLSQEDNNIHFAVQLWADGPYWATTNLGANTPTDHGSLLSWQDSNDSVVNDWGTGWSMPTMTEFQNLISNPTISFMYSTTRGINVKGKGDYAGNLIFMPATFKRVDSPNDWLYGNYWSSTINGSLADILWFDVQTETVEKSNRNTFQGTSVRPVRYSL